MGSRCPRPRAQILGLSGAPRPDPACDRTPSSVLSGQESEPPFGPVPRFPVPAFIRQLLCAYCAPGSVLGAILQ